MLKQSFLKKALFNSFSSKQAGGSSISAQPSLIASDAVSERKTSENAKKTVDAPTAIAAKSAQPKKTENAPPAKPAILLTALPKRKAAFALALLGAGSGLAFTQVAPEALPDSLQEALPGQEAAPPLRQAGDPSIEPVAQGNRGLFLTNEIFYRKIEAIAQVPREQMNTTADSKLSGADQTADQTKATSGKTAVSAGQTKAIAQSTQANKQPEKVIAAAPPAPKAAPAVYTGTTIDNVLEMRVAVAKDVSAISLATSGSGSITDLDGNPIKALSPENAVMAEINGGVTIDGQPVPSAFWVYPEDGGYVAVGSSWYRGRVLVALRERGLIAVNYVLLGDYLYSVVGTEVSPDWPTESLKAQAVAARSYALTHNISPASEAYFDLDNTQRFQAYKGISREASTTQAAVQATSGEFISHEGGIVESLYAASQAIVDDAHKGSGMSQLGAKDLANQGYSYTEILAHYYPGTALGRIETDTE